MEFLKELNSSYAGILGVILNTVILLTSIIVGLTQLFAMKKARYADVLKGIFDGIHNPTLAQERDRFFKADLSDYSKIKYEDRILVENIIDNHTKTAFICCKKLIPPKYLYEMYSGLFIKVFEHSRKYIIGKRTQSGLRNYAIYLEMTYYDCLKYRKKKRLGTNLKLDRDKQFDLLAK